jgi:hypothetical protein
VVVGIFLVSPSIVDVHGLSCAAPNVTQSFEESDIVFSGQAMSKEYLKPSDDHTLVAETLFSIKEFFKGDDRDSIKISSNEKFWGINFTEGLEYLIFADIVDKEIRSQLCGPTNLIQYSDIELVRELTQNNSKTLFEKCVIGNYEKDFGLGEWQATTRNHENNLCVMNIYWYAEADSIEYFCKVPIQELSNSDWQTSSHPLLDMEENCVVIKKNSLADPSNEYALPPIKQLQWGLGNSEIVCIDSMELIFKATDNSPACVKPSTAQKLLIRGWSMLGNP